MSRSRDWDRARVRDKARPEASASVLLTQKPATPKQLRYLRHLATQTGTTFASPTTSWQASQEIDRLQKLPKKHRK